MGGKPSKGTRKDKRLAENRRGPRAESSGPKAERGSGPSVAAGHEQGRDQQGRFA